MTPEEQAEVLAQYEQGDGVLVAVYPVDVWARVRQVPDLDLALLEAGETGGLTAINALMDRYGCGRARDPAELGSKDVYDRWRWERYEQ